MVQKEAITSNPLITIDFEADEMILNLNKIQPRIHKRLTDNVKARQLAYILQQTEVLFGAKHDNTMVP